MLDIELKESSLAGILRDLNVNYEKKFPWIYVGDSQLMQGWKFHLSSIQPEAQRLLAKVAPELIRRKCPFKFALDLRTLGMLNEGVLGDTQVGKFITIYPPQDENLVSFAEDLLHLTGGFNGPVILTDYRIGDILYTRFGSINPAIIYDRFGIASKKIKTPGNSSYEDVYDIPMQTPPGMANPFTDLKNEYQKNNKQTPEYTQDNRTLGPGYLVVDIINAQSKGGVFRCLDLRSQKNIRVKILKQGRPWCYSDLLGRDIRDRLKHQEATLRKLRSIINVPDVDAYFEDNEIGYLPMEEIEGASLEMLLVRWQGLPEGKEKLERFIHLIKLLAEICDIIGSLHETGYVHRDITARNIVVSDSDKIYLLDLELAHHLLSDSPQFDGGTPGFMSPNQQQKNNCVFDDDIFAYASLLFVMFSGIEPRRLHFIAEEDRLVQVKDLIPHIPIDLVELICRAVADNAHNKVPSLPEFKKSLLKYADVLTKKLSDDLFVRNFPASNPVKATLSDECLSVAYQGINGIFNDALRDGITGLWLTSNHESLSEEINSNDFSLKKNAHNGVAGVVYALCKFKRLANSKNFPVEKIVSAIEWLQTAPPTESETLPGLNFGSAGLAVALSEAIASGVVAENGSMDLLIQNCLNGKLDWCDITHGAAGQGIAALYCGDRLANKNFIELSHRCAHFLISNQQHDGTWITPAGVKQMSGQVFTGFGHGVAGIVYFLAEYNRRFGDIDSERSWRKGSDWLTRNAIINGNTCEWAYSNTVTDRWKWWCHGSPGIALCYLRIFEITGAKEFSEMAVKALSSVPEKIQYANLSQCHGLSGLGEIYLEAFRVLKDEQWLNRALFIAGDIINLRKDCSGSGSIWLVENPHVATAELMTGCSGIVHFLLRCFKKGEHTGFPLLLDPVRDIK